MRARYDATESAVYLIDSVPELNTIVDREKDLQREKDRKGKKAKQRHHPYGYDARDGAKPVAASGAGPSARSAGGPPHSERYHLDRALRPAQKELEKMQQELDKSGPKR